ncbi:MAG: NADH-quinone oxidoreductase subunit [Actinomycetota bacterium]|jgi:NADH-quinone oxidoreductase subunit A
MADYLPLVAMFVLATLFAAASFIASGILAPKRRTAAKEAPYECGIVPSREPAERFPVRFYLVAMIFIVFDIEIVFVYPWAVIFDRLGLFGLVEMLVFALAVVVSFAYLIANGALDWGPAKVMRPLNTIATGTTTVRTSDSTVRRIGSPAHNDAA